MCRKERLRQERKSKIEKKMKIRYRTLLKVCGIALFMLRIHKGHCTLCVKVL
jgi:hypothetical protein